MQLYLVIAIWLQDIQTTCEVTAFYNTHQDKSKAFLEASLESHWRQLSSFENRVAKNIGLVLASQKIAHTLCKENVLNRTGVCSISLS